ncbi:DUF4037 domain-containing protein [Streptobacillus moniliformis]|uniref:DUF4037 domain-containing protein n=1 Tax=Streptobacillus moniliformis TaxID=34105 RepID=UPI0007E3961E|nr:DUF4037 domain-containing protein [Streptobacillus moniliformis]
MINKFDELINERKEFQRISDNVSEVKILSEIVKMAKDIYGEMSNEYIYYLNELGGVSKYIGEYELGIKNLKKALSLIEIREGKRSIPYATSLLNLAEMYRFSGDLDNIEDIYLETLSIFDENKLEKEYVYAGLCNNIGLFYQNIGKIEKAIKYHEKSLEILLYMPDHLVELATTYNNLVMPYKEIGKIRQAYSNLDNALEIYEKTLGKEHSMYGAALNNKAILKFEEGEYRSALNISEIALEITKKSFGENSLNYKNLLSNVEYIRDIVKKSEKEISVEVTNDSKLIDKSREYTKKYILPKIKEKNEKLLSKITIALIGEGSEVIGYDDEYSKDHDYTFMPIIFLNDEDYEKYHKELEDILLSLPQEFLGIKHVNNNVVNERRGVKKIGDYLYRFIGKENANLTIEDYRKIPEHALFSLTSGEIFFAGNEELSSILSTLKYYPDVIRENKIATVCTRIAQSGQYNYLRLMKREDKIAASIAKNIFIENVIHLIYLLNFKYMPFYKWSARGLKDLPILGKEIEKRLFELIDNTTLDKHQMSNRIEEICYFLVEEIKKQGLSKEKGYFLINHAIAIQKNIDDEFLKLWTAFED